MIYKSVLILEFFLFILQSSFAQQLCKVSGLIFDASTKAPISNVNIVVRGTTMGTTTDSSGYFQIDLTIDQKYIIAFQHLAYNKVIRELSLGKDKEIVLRVYLKESEIELPEVTVTNEKSADDKRAYWIMDGAEFEHHGEKDLEKALIYFFPDIIKPMLDRIRNENNDFTLYVNGEWEDKCVLMK
ncbi:MAG: carboxypeptidase-like regulatory domain-containing protein [Ignavibacteria bacterium]